MQRGTEVGPVSPDWQVNQEMRSASDVKGLRGQVAMLCALAIPPWWEGVAALGRTLLRKCGRESRNGLLWGFWEVVLAGSWNGYSVMKGNNGVFVEPHV
jgi:hypothetical protein